MKLPDKVASRYEPLDEESKKQFLKRYKRLRKELRAVEDSLMLAAGIPPENIKKWPPSLRYMLADKVNKHGLLPGTQAYMDRQEAEITGIAEWLDGWFHRNHQKGTNDTK